MWWVNIVVKVIFITSILNANRNNQYTIKMFGMFVSTQPLLLNYNNNESMQ